MGLEIWSLLVTLSQSISEIFKGLKSYEEVEIAIKKLGCQPQENLRVTSIKREVFFIAVDVIS